MEQGRGCELPRVRVMVMVSVRVTARWSKAGAPSCLILFETRESSSIPQVFPNLAKVAS